MAGEQLFALALAFTAWAIDLTTAIGGSTWYTAASPLFIANAFNSTVGVMFPNSFAIMRINIE